MNSKRFYMVMVSLTGLLAIAIIGAAFGADIVLKQQSNKLLSLKIDSQLLTQQQDGLVVARADIIKYSELEHEAKAIVPQDKDQAEAIREIVKIAQASKVSISSILFPASTLGNATIKSSTPSGSSGESASSTTSGAPSITQTQAVPGLKGVYIMPITIQVSNAPVSYANFITFLGKLEQNRRTSQVSSVSIQPVALNPGQVNFTLIVNAYIKP